MKNRFFPSCLGLIVGIMFLCSFISAADESKPSNTSQGSANAEAGPEAKPPTSSEQKPPITSGPPTISHEIVLRDA